MIITQTPFRISLGGGGTDLTEYYSKYGSMFISAAIDKYMVITYYRTPFFSDIHLKYSKNETVKKIDDIQHDIIRETLRFYNISDHVEIVSHADIPAGTGLGSSGSFSVGLIKAFSPDIYPFDLADKATFIQQNILNHPIGKQDQYVAAFGGINSYTIEKDGLISVHPLFCDYGELAQKLVMFFTGFTRDAKKVLSQSNFEGLHRIQEIGYKSKKALEQNNFKKFGELMKEHWEYKKQRLDTMSNPKIDEWYNLAMNNSAIGGKLIGAGGGGFLLFVAENKQRLIKAMPLLHLPFNFDFNGSKVLLK